MSGSALGGGDGLALLGYSDAGWRVGTPMPIPTAIPIDLDDGRQDWVPGLRFELFRARF